VVLAGSPLQKAGFLVYNWLVTLAEARADDDHSRVYLSQLLVGLGSSNLSEYMLVLVHSA
jgi:hypothetical protein